MKKEFKYQKFYLRAALCGAAVLMWIIISLLIVKYFSSPLVYLLFSAAVTVAIMVLYYKNTDKLPMFCGKGEFYEEDGQYHISIGKRLCRLDDIKGLYAWKAKLYGTGFWVMQINYGSRKLKIFSKVCDTTFVATDLYGIFHTLLEANSQLKQEKDANGDDEPYFYSM